MSRTILRGGIGRTVALLGFSGFICSCSSVGWSGLSRSALADTPAAPAAMHVNATFDILSLEQQFEAVAGKASPAVVAICATDAPVPADGLHRHGEMNADKLSDILDAFDRNVGTGFIIDANGYIVTNEHVIGKSEQIWVTTDDHKVYSAIVIGSDPRADLAVLKIPATHLPTVTFGDGAAVRRGQWTLAVGNPYGLADGGEMAVSVGVVSATGRALPKLAGKEDRLYSDLIQTTAQINPGSSGGPLLDVQGHVIGINTAVILPQKRTNGIGFAMPVTPRLRQIIDHLKQGAEITYGYLGVHATTATLYECQEAGVKQEGGAKVDVVESNSPAALVKIQVGDIIVRLNDDPICDSEQLIREVGAAPIGQAVPIQIARNHQVRDIMLHLRRRESVAVGVQRGTQRLRWHGLLLGPIPPRWSPVSMDAIPAAVGPATRPAASSLSGGIMVFAVDPHGPLAGRTIPGTIIRTVAGRAVPDIATLQQVLNDVPADECVLGFSEPRSAVVSIREPQDE